jgi:hypothetical protein
MREGEEIEGGLVPVEDDFIGWQQRASLGSDCQLTPPSHAIIFPFAIVDIATHPLVLAMAMFAVLAVSGRAVM